MSDPHIPRSFTPSVLDEDRTAVLATVLVRLNKCGACRRPMVPNSMQRDLPSTGWRGDIAEQAQRAGWTLVTKYARNADDAVVCDECADAGHATILCALCKQVRPAKESEESFGQPPEHLCQPCYATVPAKRWEERVKELSEAHRYDFE